MPTKLFLSHASEDKADFVEPLAIALKAAGYDVWYDKFVLTMGDRLLQKIDEGLKQCDYGIVVLSEAFFTKKWPQDELNGLFALEPENKKLILPIWKNVTEKEVKAFSPILAGRIAAKTNQGIERVVEMIQQATSAVARIATFESLDSAAARIAKASKDRDAIEHNAAMLTSGKGIELSLKAFERSMVILKETAEELKRSQRVPLEIQYQSGSINIPRSLIIDARREQVVISIGVGSSVDYLIGREPMSLDARIYAYTTNPPTTIHDIKLFPFIHFDNSVSWKSKATVLTNEQLPAYLLEKFAAAIERRSLHL